MKIMKKEKKKQPKLYTSTQLADGHVYRNTRATGDNDYILKLDGRRCCYLSNGGVYSLDGVVSTDRFEEYDATLMIGEAL